MKKNKYYVRGERVIRKERIMKIEKGKERRENY